MGHRHFVHRDAHPHMHGERHGYDLSSLSRHASIAEAIKECQVLIVGGMGMAAYESMRRFNIEPIVTDVSGIADAMKLSIEGKLPNLINRVD